MIRLIDAGLLTWPGVVGVGVICLSLLVVGLCLAAIVGSVVVRAIRRRRRG